MRKSVTVINDELGTIALGFSRAGYEIEAIYLDTSDANSVQVCVKNWEGTARITAIEDLEEERDREYRYVSRECIAGRLFFPAREEQTTTADQTAHDRLHQQVLEVTRSVRPGTLLFHCNKIGFQNKNFRRFTEQLNDIGYVVYYRRMLPEELTGFPVKESDYLMVGVRRDRADCEQWRFPREDVMQEPFFTFLDKPYEQKLMQELYEDYQVNDWILDHIDWREADTKEAVLCWDRDYFKKVEQITWNAV